MSSGPLRLTPPYPPHSPNPPTAAQPEEEAFVKSFRNLPRLLIVEPSELEVGAIVWARSVLATEGALERVTEVVSK